MADLKTLNTTYPVSKDTASPVVTGDAIVAPLWNGVFSAVVAIENELGVGLRGSATDLTTRLSFLIAANGSLRSGTSFPAPPPAGIIDLFFRTDEKNIYVFDPSVNFGIGGYIPITNPAPGSIIDSMIASTGITTRSKLPANLVYDDEPNVFTLLNRFTQELNLDGNLAFKSGTLNKMTLDHAATADQTVTFPDATDTVAMVSLAQTLLNKTLTAPAINGGTIAGAAITGAAITGGTIAGAAITGGTLAGAAITGGTIVGAAITGGTVAAAQLTGLASIPVGAGIIPAANLPSGIGVLLNVQIFSASGTWTKPVGVTKVVCDCIIVGGGGGGGGHNSFGSGRGGDGGLGGRVSAVFGFVSLPVISDLTLPVAVGAGGAGGGTNISGADGGSSSFNGIVCGGGGGGITLILGSPDGPNGADGVSPQGGTSPTFNPTAIPYFGYNGGIGSNTAAGTAGSNGVVIIRTYSA